EQSTSLRRLAWILHLEDLFELARIDGRQIQRAFLFPAVPIAWQDLVRVREQYMARLQDSHRCIGARDATLADMELVWSAEEALARWIELDVLVIEDNEALALAARELEQSAK